MPVTTEVHGRVLLVRLDRDAKLNAMDHAMTLGLDAAMNRLEDDELLLHVYVPVPGADERNHYVKIKQKQSFDWPLAEVALNVRRGGAGKLVQSAKIVLGSVAPVPYRAKGAEAELVRIAKADEASLKVVGEAAIFGAMPLSKNGYKVPLVSGLVQRALAELLASQ